MAEISEQIIREAPEIEAYKIGLLQSAKNLSQQPLNLPAFQAAPLSSLQQASINQAMSGIGSYAPFIQAGQGALQAGIGTLGAGAQMASGINYSPLYNQAVQAQQYGIGLASQIPALASQAASGYGNISQGTSALNNAMNMATGYSQANFAPSQALLGQAASGTVGATGGYDPYSAAAFMNPYQQAVTQQALQEMQRQANIAKADVAAQGVRSGSFGSTREGVQRSELERNLQDVMSQRLFQDYAQNYLQAQNAGMSAFEQQQQRQLAGAGQLAGIGSTYGNQAVQQAQLGQAGAGLLGQLGSQQAQVGLLPGQLAAQQAGILGQGSQLYNQLGLGIGSLAGQQAAFDLDRAQAMGQFGQSLGALGSQQADLGRLASSLGVQDINTLMTLGGLQQQTEQSRLDALRATGTQQAMTPYQQTSFLSDIYKGAPGTQMSLTAGTAPTTSPLLQAAGLGIAGLSALSGAKTANLIP